MQNESEDIGVKSNDNEGFVENASNENEVKQTVEPFLKKKRGKKK